MHFFRLVPTLLIGYDVSFTILSIYLLKWLRHFFFKVNGYQDTIFEAMNVLENAEIVPTVETYNCIIYAFSEACAFFVFTSPPHITSPELKYFIMHRRFCWCGILLLGDATKGDAAWPVSESFYTSIYTYFSLIMFGWSLQNHLQKRFPSFSQGTNSWGKNLADTL